MKEDRSHCQSFHTLRGSITTFATPQKLTKVSCNSGVKNTPIQNNDQKIRNRSLNNTSITTIKQLRQRDIYDYVQELESKIQNMEQMQYSSLNESKCDYQEIQKILMQVLNENCQLKKEQANYTNIDLENQQLRILVQQQQDKILEFNEQYNQLFDSHKKVCEEYQTLENKIQQFQYGQQIPLINKNNIFQTQQSFKKHSSFSEYFKDAQ